MKAEPEENERNITNRKDGKKEEMEEEKENIIIKCFTLVGIRATKIFRCSY